MNITLDVIMSTIIGGMLILMILSTNILVLKSTTENRISYDLQNAANNTIKLIQEEIRGASSPELKDDNTKLVFNKINGDSVIIYHNNRNLIIENIAPNGTSDINQYALKIASLNFFASPQLLNVEVVTESTPEQEVGNQSSRFKAFAQRAIHLRNIDYINRN